MSPRSRGRSLAHFRRGRDVDLVGSGRSRTGYRAGVDRARGVRRHRRSSPRCSSRARSCGRQLRFRGDDLKCAAQPGAGPALMVVDGLVGIVGAVVLVRYCGRRRGRALSPLAPLGTCSRGRACAPHRVRLTVLGLGPLVLIVTLRRSGVRARVRGAPHRVAHGRRDQRTRVRDWRASGDAIGLSPTAATGIRFAVEPGSARTRAHALGDRGRRARDRRRRRHSDLRRQPQHPRVAGPRCTGGNWSYELRSAYSGVSNIPERLAVSVLDRDKYIAAWTGVYFASMRIDD